MSDAPMTMVEAQQHWRDLASRCVAAINAGVFTYRESTILLQSSAMRSRRLRNFTVEQRIALAEYCETALGEACVQPSLAATRDIRAAVAPVIHARKPRAEVYLAAHRAAAQRISTAVTEQIAEEEIAAFMARLRASTGVRNAG